MDSDVSCSKPVTEVPLSHRLLSAYYGRVVPLLDYVLDIAVGNDHDPGSLRTLIMRPGDPESFKDMVTLSLVASNTQLGGSLPRFPIHQPVAHMLEVIDKAQGKLFHRESGKPSNIITSGYRSAARRGDPGKAVPSRQGVTMYFVNTIVTALQSSDWELLLSRVGDQVMYHLLTETSMFASLPNDCFCQLSGTPLVYMKPPLQDLTCQLAPQPSAWSLPDEDPQPKSLKRKASLTGSQKAKSTRHSGRPLTRFGDHTKAALDPNHAVVRTPADIPFVRTRLFYARPVEVPNQMRISIGLPPTHILNRLGTSSMGKTSQTDTPPDSMSREQQAKARHLSKYIFPRQYGLESPFLSLQGDSTSQQYSIKNFADRELEIKTRGSCKTPKRLKAVLDELSNLLKRHAKCGYKPLCDKICPSKLGNGLQSSLDDTLIFEMISEQSIELRSQMRNRSMGSYMSATSAHGASLAATHTAHKPKFTDFTCSHAEVFLFAKSVTKFVIPHSLWGSERNWRLLLKNVKRFICSRKYETMTLHSVLQDFSTADCDWLLPRQKTLQRPHVADAMTRRELSEEFLYWYFEAFLIPLLKTTFYVTESSAFRNKVLYFRQDDWQTLCQPLLDRLTKTTFQRIKQHEAEELLQNRKLGFSCVRLLPKDTGVRPIVNLRRRRIKAKPNGAFEQPQSINQILQASFRILNYEKDQQPNALGASVFGPNQVYLKLKDYKRSILKDGGTLPKLWFVKVDVQACFDSIEQGKLLEILKDLISEDAYMIQRYGTVAPVTGKIRRTYTKRAGPECEHPHFLTQASQLASLLRHAIFVDQVVYPFAYRDDIIKLLEDHITNNIVKIGQDYYRQMVGIPQGSVLSTLLCSFMYGHLENTSLKSITENDNNVLLRLVDDYLFITTNLLQAQRFLDVMNEGHPEYGCFIATDKTLTNFDHGPQLTNLASYQNEFPWCGYLFHMSTLSISSDYSRFHENYLTDSLTVERGRRPGAMFMHKMLQMAKHKSHMIYCDTALNSLDTVHKNIYQNFLVTAMKMHHYIRAWGISAPNHYKFIRDTLWKTIRYTYTSIRNKATNRISIEGLGRCEIQRSSIMWLGAHAFHTVLSKKPTSYGRLLRSLKFDLSLPQYRRMSHRFRALTSESLECLGHIRF